jgi:nitrite reductase (NADH) small subunit
MPQEWQPVCGLAELEIGRGVTALVHGQAVAIFRTDDRTVFALGNHDPFVRGASAGLAKGIVGRRGGVWFVGSPAHRHAFDLRTGRCLEDAQVAVPAYDVKVLGGTVHVGHRKVDAA